MTSHPDPKTGLLASRVIEFIRDSTETHACTDTIHYPSLFNELALEVFRFQYQEVAAYQKLCESRSFKADCVSNWWEIPAVISSAFKEFELSSIPQDQRATYFCSSGTTGQNRSRHFHHAESIRLYETSLVSGFKRVMAGESLSVQVKPRFLFLTPSATEAPHSSLVHMFTILGREFAESSLFSGSTDQNGNWISNFQPSLEFLELAIRDQHPVFVLGTAFNFVLLMDQFEDQGITLSLPHGSAALETGGYKNRSRSLSKDELHGSISKWGAIPRNRILCEYGMSELSSQAYDLGLGADLSDPQIFHFPPWARVRIISPETGLEVPDGEKGLIRIFDLANLYSVMAIQTEDLGVRRGSGFEWVGRAAQSEPRGCSLQSVNVH